MTDSGLIIPNELSKIVNERTALWQKYDESQYQMGEIEKLALEVASITPAEIPPELTGSKTPSAEIAAALQGLQAELTEISKAQASIRAHEEEIQRLKTRRQNIIVAIIAIAIVIILIVLYGMQMGF